MPLQGLSKYSSFYWYGWRNLSPMLKKENLLFFLLFVTMSQGVHAQMTDVGVAASSGLYTAQRDAYGHFIADTSFRFYSVNTGRCAGPVYRCRGIMVSAFEADDNYWMRAFPELNKLSLSYWARRTTGQTLDDAAWLGAGFMLWPSVPGEWLSGGYFFTPRFTCVFATEGLTGSQLHNGCGGDWNIAWPKCQEKGIHTANEYIRRFGDKRLAACGFELGVSSEQDALAFDSALALQRSEIKNYGGTFYNEVLIKGWDAPQPARIPLMGFFYIMGGRKLTPSGYLEIAKKNQHTFYKTTHIFVPVIRVTGHDWAHVKFEYRRKDQSHNIPEDVRVNVDIEKASYMFSCSLLRNGIVRIKSKKVPPCHEGLGGMG